MTARRGHVPLFLLCGVQLRIIRTCTPAGARLARGTYEPLRSLCQRGIAASPSGLARNRWRTAARYNHVSPVPQESGFGNRDLVFQVAAVVGRFVVRCQPQPKTCKRLRCPPVGAAEDSHEGGN
jgi:hypothetical protein